MSISGISGGAGLGAIQHHHRWENFSNVSGQTTDTSLANQTGSQVPSDSTQAAGASSPAQSTLSALLGGLAALGGSPDSAQPPQEQWGGHAHSFGRELASLLQSVQSGDMTRAQSAAIALQSILNGGSPTAASASTPNPASTQSPFLTDLNSLLSAVQSGNAAASQTAAAAVTSDLKSQTNAPQGQWPGLQASSAYLQWSNS
jgi:hypothetical protein